MSSDNNVARPRLLFAADLHPDHNFMMQRHSSIVSALSDYEIEFIDIFGFLGEDDAYALESRCTDATYMREYFGSADLPALNRTFRSRLARHHWDILCLCTISHFSYYLLPETIRSLSREKGTVVGFFGDDETMFAEHKFWVGMFDAVVAYTEAEVRRYQCWNPFTYLLPIGMGKQLSIPEHSTQDIDVIFVGRPYGIRAALVRKLKRAGIPIRVFGSRQWERYSDLREVYRGYLKREDFWRQLKRAKIVLNLMEDATGQSTHINAKVFEAAMVGAFCLTTYYRPFETTYGLREGYSIEFYRDAEELVTKTQFYLRNPGLRTAIAQRMQEHLSGSLIK
ncbi:MAG: glycosyltransferase family protein [Anaerolineae bacterium]